jgi:hypothetical protein
MLVRAVKVPRRQLAHRLSSSIVVWCPQDCGVIAQVRKPHLGLRLRTSEAHMTFDFCDDLVTVQ